MLEKCDDNEETELERYSYEMVLSVLFNYLKT
jgi:hypothetical protein